MPDRYVKCANGNYINPRLVLRWSVQQDVTMNGATLVAHPAQPDHAVIVSKHSDEGDAQIALDCLITALENGELT